MKYNATDPLAAALATGGCTLDPERGWWTFSTTPRPEVGGEFTEERDAVYIPTLQKNGVPVATEHVQSLRNHARALGFNNEMPASGMWILSETGEAQIEYVWILWAKRVGVEVRQTLPALGEEIKNLTNQDSVAYELGGELKFI